MVSRWPMGSVYGVPPVTATRRKNPREFWVVVGGYIRSQALYVHWGCYRKSQVLRWAQKENPLVQNLEAVRACEKQARKASK